MNKIKEVALRDLPVKVTGNGWNDWDENEVKREGYILGANAVLSEIKNYIQTATQEHEVGVIWLGGLINVINKLEGKE